MLLRGVRPEWILRAISAEKITIVWLLVPWAQDILDAIEREDVKLEDYDLSRWRLMHIGAQPVPPSLIHRWKKYFPGHLYDTNYGLSESVGPGCVHPSGYRGTDGKRRSSTSGGRPSGREPWASWPSRVRAS